MKTLFLFLINSLIISAYAQTITIEYKLQRNISEKKLKEQPGFAKKAFSKDYFYTLTSSNSISEYIINDSINGDVYNSEEENRFEIEIDNSMQKYIYKDLKKNTTYAQLFLIDEIIHLKDTLINREWEITSDSKIIMGFHCKKAISKKFKQKTYAWFTEEINIKTGPDFFDGLPGLILEVNSKHFNWIAISIETKPIDTIIKQPDYVGETYTFKQGEKISKEKNLQEQKKIKIY